MSAEAIQQLSNSVPLKIFWSSIASYSEPVFIGLLIVFWIRFFWRRNFSTWVVPAQITLSLAVAIPLNRMLRGAIMWSRPFETGEFKPLVEHAGGPGFPSNHALATAIFTIVLVRFEYYRTGLIIGIVTIFVGISRVFTAIHYPRDIIAGWVLGGTIALICSLWENSGYDWVKKYGPLSLDSS